MIGWTVKPLGWAVLLVLMSLAIYLTYKAYVLISSSKWRP